MVRLSTIVIVMLWVGATGAVAADAPAELPLFGFEDADVQKLVTGIKATAKEGKDKDARPTLTVSRDYVMQPWTLYKGDASQGDYAMGLSKVAEPAAKGTYATPVRVPDAAAKYYGVTNGGGAVFNTCGVFRKIFPADWSAYDLFRVDVKCDGAAHTFAVTMEDEEIAPPVLRTFVIEPGKWVTLEIDLRVAANARGLDLRRMATLTLGVTNVAASDKPLPKGRTALMDNVRLARADAPAAALPVVRDASPHDLPEYYKASKRPKPAGVPAAAPDFSPLPADLTPIVIPTEKTSVVNPVGWVAAYDNNRLLVGFMEKNSVPPADVFALQSRDAGKTWRGLDGGPKPASFMIVGSDHGGGRGDVVGDGSNVVLLSNLGCRGGSLAALRLFAHQLSFTGDGWALRELPTLVDCDLRHCNSNQSVVRTADNRMWAAYGMAGRLGATCVNVRYSDDDGVTWKSWAQGKSGAIPGMTKPPFEGWTYQFEEPSLVPMGDGLACVWREVGGPENAQIRWARFKDGQWSAPETIPTPKPTSTNPTMRPQVTAVSRGGDEVFVAGARFGGVMHFKDGRWAHEAAADIPRGCRLSVAGDRAVFAVTAVYDNGDVMKGGATIKVWRRHADGRWAPRDVAREETPLSNKSGGGDVYFYRPGFVVQPYAPPNCVPIAWTCEGHKWIKVLRVPVTDE